MNKLKCVAVGFCGKDPEKIQNQNTGKEYYRFSIAVTEKRGEKKYTNWVTIYDYGDIDYSAARTIKKGDLVYVEGSPWARGYRKGEQIVGQLCLNADLGMILKIERTAPPPSAEDKYAPEDDVGLPWESGAKNVQE